MREVTGSTWSFQIIIIFILIFACFLSMVLTYSKAYTIKNRMLTIVEKYEDNFAVDSKAAKEFAEKVKDAVAKKDLEALAELTSFPVYVGLPNVGGVESKEDFLKLGAEKVFTDELNQWISDIEIERHEAVWNNVEMIP